MRAVIHLRTGPVCLGVLAVGVGGGEETEATQEVAVRMNG
jgi:hypothetical protein